MACQWLTLQCQLQLIRGLGRAAEPVGAVSCELVTEFLDEDSLRLHLGQEARREGPTFVGVFWQRSGLVQRDGSLSDWIPSGNPLTEIPANYPAASGRQVRCGVRQSIPSNSIAS